MNIDIKKITKELSLLPESTDSNNWPHVKEILYTERQPAIWAEICASAVERTTSTVLKIWFRLEQINGLRRQPGLWDISQVVLYLDETKKMIDGMADTHPRKLRLLELWAYHSGWVYRPAGKFKKAEKAHRIELEIAKKRGEKKAALLAEHNMILAQLENAVLAQQNQAILTKLLKKFSLTNKKYQEILSPDNIDDIRWSANILCHEAWYAWLISGQKINNRIIKLIAKLLAEAQVSTDITVIFSAINAYDDKKYQKGLEIISAINPSMPAYWRSYAQLIKLLILKKLGETEAVERVRKEIRNIPKNEHGGYLAVALLKKF